MSLTLERIIRVVGGETWLDDVTLQLQPGSLNVLLGPTLAGKTSLLRMMAGLDRPSSGKVMVDDRDVTGVALQKRNVAMVYQQFINYPSFSVFENIASPLRRQGLARSEIDARVRQTAAHAAHRRLARPLARRSLRRPAAALRDRPSVVKDARLLLLDEPLVNLDYKLREELGPSCRRCSAGATRSSSTPRPSPPRP